MACVPKRKQQGESSEGHRLSRTQNTKGSSEATLTKPQHEPQEGETATNSSHPKTGLNTAYRNVQHTTPNKVKFKMADITHKLPDTQKDRKTRPRTRRRP